MNEPDTPPKDNVAAIDAVFQEEAPLAPPPAPAPRPAPPPPLPRADPSPDSGAATPHVSPLGDYVRELGQEFQQQEDESTL